MTNKYIIFFIFTFSAILTVFSLRRTDGFTTYSIMKNKNIDTDYDFDYLVDPTLINNILSQPFYYLNRGRQCFVFESLDKKYVIKFYDKERFNLFYYFPKLPLPKLLNDYRNKHYFRRKNRLGCDLISLKLAFENLKDDAALEYIHVNKSNNFINKLLIFNKCREKFLVDLNDSIFVVQKKCEIFFNIFEASNDFKRKELIKGFIEMADRRCKKNIIDDDIGKKRRNWAILQDQVVNIDVGRWYFDEKLIYYNVYEKEMKKATKTLKKYLAEFSFDLENFLEGELNRYYLEYRQSHPKSL